MDQKYLPKISQKYSSNYKYIKLSNHWPTQFHELFVSDFFNWFFREILFTFRVYNKYQTRFALTIFPHKIQTTKHLMCWLWNYFGKLPGDKITASCSPVTDLSTSLVVGKTNPWSIRCVLSFRKGGISEESCMVVLVYTEISTLPCTTFRRPCIFGWLCKGILNPGLIIKTPKLTSRSSCILI